MTIVSQHQRYYFIRIDFAVRHQGCASTHCLFPHSRFVCTEILHRAGCFIYGLSFDYRIATTFGGDATPPLTLRGALAMKNDHFLYDRHLAANASRSQSSPIGQPHRAISQSCKPGTRLLIHIENFVKEELGHILCGGLVGQASKAKVSEATATKCFSQSHFTVCSLPSSPICWSPVEPFERSWSLAWLYHSIQPVRMISISAGRNSTPWHFATSSMSAAEIAVRSITGWSSPLSLAH